MRSIVYELLTTPPKHLDLLFEPPADRIRGTIATAIPADYRNAAILDSNVAALRSAFRRRVGLRGPIILTGHQCEFFHAGVLAKLIAASRLAEIAGAEAVHLAVDSDLPKTTHLTVPRIDQGFVRQVRTPIPGCDPRLPMEGQKPISKTAWREFFDRISGDVPDAALGDYIEGVASVATDAVSFTDATLAGQEAVLRSLGLRSLPVLRVSDLAATPDFRVLSAHIALDARRFAKCYNEAQRGFRQTHRVRNPLRPAPRLLDGPERTELPFWIYRSGTPRRRMFVSQTGDRIRLYADDETVGDASAEWMRSMDSHEQPWAAERDGWRIRPRGLMLSAWMRLFLSDLFIHGIGGAKYDEMTEAFVRSFFGVELTPLCSVSATVWLPLPTSGRTIEEVGAARRALRDIRFNAPRYNDSLPAEIVRERSELIRTCVRLRENRPPDRTARRSNHIRLRDVHSELYEQSSASLSELERAYRRMREEYESDRSAFDREYFFALHPRGTLLELATRIHDSLTERRTM